jgi:protein gp37
MVMWSPWRGCRRYSEGCKFCYIHKGDVKRGIDTNNIVKMPSFFAPVAKKKNGEYAMKSGQLVYLCFQTDFLIAEADTWSGACWAMIRERSDLHFVFLTKRIERLDCIPPDYVTIGVSVENQDMANFRLRLLSEFPIKHKNVICQPLLERINIEKYLCDVELVVVGGESDKNARPLDFDWVLDIREQCKRHNVRFVFRQCGTHFIKDGKRHVLNYFQLMKQAREFGINC